MLELLGFKTRVAYGYSIQDGSFQPHAWVEVYVNNSTIPVDPTYGEAGALSADHIIMLYSNDTTLPDTLNFMHYPNSSPDSTNRDVFFSTNYSVTVIQSRGFEGVGEISSAYDNQSGSLEITIRNPTTDNLLMRYDFLSPPTAYGEDSAIIALSPNQSLSFTYSLDKKNLLENYVYTIPFTAMVQGTTLNSSVDYSTVAGQPVQNSGNATNNPKTGQEHCIPAYIFMLLLTYLGLWVYKR